MTDSLKKDYPLSKEVIDQIFETEVLIKIDDAYGNPTKFIEPYFELEAYTLPS